MRVVRPRVSFADLQRAPEDGRRYQLYDGEVFAVPSPIPLHQIIVDRFADLLRAYRRENGRLLLLSPIDIVLSDFDCVQPDIVFFTRDRGERIDLQKPIRVAPDLVVEVLSPSTASTDRGRKMQMFARYRVREYWLVDPDEKAIEVYCLADDAYALTDACSGAHIAESRILFGFSVDASALFDI